MNIKQAKEYIKNSVNLYLKKDEFGEYKVPVVRQRPIFLLGAPGIGKTAVMEQIAQEMGLALVAYSMTHHTRQSALGLPFITQKTYGGKEYSISEYTMSEIIASVYETMEQSGIKEGILFLDEINCVSETLAPSMLQFLQYKVFGRHQVPEGWVIVTAGNPPEYNKSVREFDVVTMDRLKILRVEPDYRVWKEYASDRRIHSAVLNYLDLKKDHFYVMEMTTAGRSFVTARGWEDLSEILYLYEEEQLPVEESLAGQYLHNERVVKEFTAYYDLYNKYKKDYCIQDILEGQPSVQAIARAGNANFDERLSLLGMLLDRVQADMKEVMDDAAFLTELKVPLKAIKTKVEKGAAGQGKAALEQTGQGNVVSGNAERGEAASEQTGQGNVVSGNAERGKAASEQTGQGNVVSGLEQILQMLDDLAEGRRKLLQNLQTANSLSEEEKKKHLKVIRFLEEARKELYISDLETEEKASEGQAAFAFLQQKYNLLLSRLKQDTAKVQNRLHALFVFAEEAFAEGNEMLILVTELTAGKASSQFIATFGSEDYSRHNQELMLSERQAELKGEIAALTDAL